MNARLYFRGFDADALSAVFAREGQLVGKKALRQMRLVSKLVMEQSIKNTPVDWRPAPGAGGKRAKSGEPGRELEQAHHIEESYGNLGRLEATVSVGGMVGNVNTDLYATWIHDGIHWSELGPESQKKSMQGPDYKVGPLFLERALAEYDSEYEGDAVWNSFLDDVVGGFDL